MAFTDGATDIAMTSPTTARGSPSLFITPENKGVALATTPTPSPVNTSIAEHGAHEFAEKIASVNPGIAHNCLPIPTTSDGGVPVFASHGSDRPGSPSQLFSATVPTFMDGGSFPCFDDGDVLIIAPTGKKWKLHSMTLKNTSKDFRAILGENEALHLTKRQRLEGQTVQWKLEMMPWAKNPSENRFRTFRAVDMTHKRTPSMFIENINGIGGNGEPPYLKVYDNFFRCLYNLDPNLTDAKRDTNAEGYVYDVVSILQAAECHLAVQAVKIIVEGYLLRLNQVLWQAIGGQPEAWSDLAVRLQSPTMFREALIHIVGAYDLKGGVRKDYLRGLENGAMIEALAEKKAHELKIKKLEVERRLTDYYPPKMLKPVDGDYVSGRAKYAEDIYLWQALMLFRQYVTSNCLSNNHHRSKDGGLNFYRIIEAGGKAYLGPETLARFHENFAMSIKGKRCLAQALDYVKNELKVVVQDLLQDRMQFNRGANKLGYLTCTEILDEELPWPQNLLRADSGARAFFDDRHRDLSISRLHAA